VTKNTGVNNSLKLLMNNKDGVRDKCIDQKTNISDQL